MVNPRLEELRSKFQENPRRYFAPFANELRKAGDPAQAIAVCRTHLAGQPGHVSGHIVLGQALYEAANPDEARDVFTAALELDPENLIALRTLGEIAQVNGDFDAARQWYERLLEADPRNTEVASLVNDLPATKASPFAPPAAGTFEDDERLPDNARRESVPAAPPSNFHTRFTGSTPTIPLQPEPIPEPSEEMEREPVGLEMVDLSPSTPEAHEEPEPEVEVAPVSATIEPSDSVEMIDFTSFSTPAEEEPVAYETVPDESHESGIEQAAAEDLLEMNAEMHAGDFISAEVDQAVDPVPQAEIEVAAMQPEPEEPASSNEPPRAIFAELGFDGPVDDQLGWMTTPSAALSDPEAAPDDWFDESAMFGADGVAAAQAEEPVAAEAGAPSEDPATDSWFAEASTPAAEPVESVESTDQNDEFWLSPNLGGESSGQPAEHQTVSLSEEPSASIQPEAEEPVEVSSAFEARDTAAADSMEYSEQPVEAHEPLEAQSDTYWMTPTTAHEEQPAQDIESEPLEVVSAWAEPSAPSPEVMPEPVMEAEHQEVSADAASWHEEATEGASAEADSADSVVEPMSSALEAFMGLTPASVEAVSPTPPAPFVTETLAELYLQQGFRDESLAIYRELAERDPSNESIHARLHAIEHGEVSPVARASEESIENRAASQSVRSFFSRLARRPAVSPPPASEATKEDSGSSPDVPFAAAASALANLFAASKPPAADEGAASTLAGAFSDPAGRPSRAAERELSLDHLFRDVPPGASGAGGVSLDEFYATPDATPDSPTEPGAAAESEEASGTDIRQFTAWLEGLRKK